MRKIIRFINRNCCSILLIMFIIILLLLMITFRDTINLIVSWFSNSNNLLFVATLFLGIITYVYSITSRRTMWHTALLDVHKDYRSPEMMSAIELLWTFYKDCEYKKYDLKERYKQRAKKEKKDKMEMKETLNYNRRLLTHFYAHLASIYKQGILPDKMIFDWWIPSDLEMVDKFIIPLEEAASEQHYLPKKEVEFAMKPLKELKEACEFYFFQNKNDC